MDFFIIKEELKYQAKRIFSNKIYLGSFISFLIVAFLATYLYIDYKNNKDSSFIGSYFAEPQIVGANFDLDYKKIPQNMAYIELEFNKKLDKSTITSDNFSISPKIDGKLELLDGHKIRYTFDKVNLKIGAEISVIASRDIKTRAGENIVPYSSYLSVGEVPKVVSIIPETKDGKQSSILSSLNSHISVFFNVPMIPLTDLDSRDKFPCLIDIEPKISGKCVWTTTSMQEFIPDSPLPGASRFNIKVSDKPGTLYKLSEEKTSYIETESLKIFTGASFSPNKGFDLHFNFSISKSDLEKELSIFDEKNKKIDFLVESIKGSETDFIVYSKNREFRYSKIYNISINKGLKAKKGNLEMKTDFKSVLQTSSFISYISNYEAKYSLTGASLEPVNTDGISYYYDVGDVKIIANKNAYVEINLDEEVSLDKNLFRFEAKDGKKINYDLSYIKEDIEDDKGLIKQVENKKRISLEIKDNLDLAKDFSLIISKDANISLGNDIVYAYKTVFPLRVLDYKYLGYNKACLYTNGILGFSGDYYKKDYSANFTYSPTAKIFSVGEYASLGVDNDYYYSLKEGEMQTFNALNETDKNKKLVLAGACPMAPKGQVLYIINHRLNPNSSYKFTTSHTAKDIFGNNIVNFLDKTVKTGNDIKDIDKYVYTTISKDINVIPKTSPLVFAVQTINLDNITLEACEMDKSGYLDYMSNRYTENYNPKCIKNTIKKLPVKNKFWDISFSKFDLEKDVIGDSSSADFVLIIGYKDSFGKNQSNGTNFQNLFIRSDMSLMLEKGGDSSEAGSNRSIIFASDFAGNPIKNLKIEAYRNENGLYTKKDFPLTYDEKKGVYITNQIDLYGYILFGEADGKTGVITSDIDETSNYDLGYLSGIDTFTKDFLYLYTDRPLYKPGDKVYFKGLLRKFGITGYKVFPFKEGTLELIDENYKTIKSLKVKLDKSSNFAGVFDLQADSQVGKYAFRFTVSGGQEIINNADFSIQEYKKPVFKVNINQDKKDFVLGETTNLKVNPEYYFGGKVISTKGTYSVLSQSYYFDAKDYMDYQFGETSSYFDCLYWGACSYNDNLDGVKDFQVGETGTANISYTFPNDIEKAERLYTLTAEVEDPDTKKVVSNQVSAVVHTTDAYMGISAPWWNDKKKGILFKGVVLDYDAKALEGKDVKIEVYKRTYKGVKKQGVDGSFYNDYALEDKLEQTINLSSDKSGIITQNIVPKSDGEYFIKAIYTGKNGKSFVSSKEIFVSTDAYIEWNNGNNDITDLIQEKSILKVGETANYILKSPVNSGKALVMIEKDDGIIDYFLQDIVSFAQKISVPVLDGYYPNFYIKVFLIGKGNAELPVYKRALASTKVVSDYKKLNVQIIPEKKTYLPGDKLSLTIKVKDQNGKGVSGANGSIAVVDESLLALLGNPKKNPFAFFYEMKRFLGTVTYISLRNLVEKLEVKDIRDGEKGGAGEGVKGGNSNKKRGVFKDTAYWKSDFTTDKNGEFKIITDALPDNLTTWDIETIVTSPNDNKVGIARTSVQTSKKVMINDNLPAFLGSSDEIIFSPVVFNKTGKDSDFEINFSGTNLDLEKTSEKVFIKAGGQTTLHFKAKVSEVTNLASNFSKINIKAVSKETSDLDEVENTLPLYNTFIREQSSILGFTNSSKTEKLYLANIIKNPGFVNINYGTTLLSGLTDSIDYLNNYPYGCSEQRTSAIMPNIFIKELYNSAKIDYDLREKMIDYYAGKDEGYKKKSLDETIKDYLVSIKKFQKSNGGFGYWADLSKGNNYADFHLSSYILESISHIRDISYKIDTESTDRLKDYIKNRFYKDQIEGCTVTKYNDCTYSPDDKLYAIRAILAYDSSDYEAYKMYRLIDFKKILQKNDNSIDMANAMTMASLYSSKKLDIDEKARDALRREIKNIATNILNNELVYNPRGAYIGRNTYYSRIENTANFLSLISKAGLENFKDIETVIDNINRWIISEKTDTGFGSTQENIAVIKAFRDYLESSKELQSVSLNLKIDLNGKEVDSQNFSNDNKLLTFSKIINFSDLSSENDINFSKTGTGKVYYDISNIYYLPAKDVKARDSGFYLETEYFDYDDYKKIEVLKNEEWEKYMSGEISYDKLKYPNEINSYINEVKKAKVGELLVVYNKLIVAETRDKVAFEGFIPAGAEIVNPDFTTSTAKAKEFANNFFDRTEYRLDRFFAYKRELNPGNYDFMYLIRASHSGIFNLKSSKISEFYTPEVFGRTAGKEFIVE